MIKSNRFFVLVTSLLSVLLLSSCSFGEKADVNNPAKVNHLHFKFSFPKAPGGPVAYAPDPSLTINNETKVKSLGFLAFNVSDNKLVHRHWTGPTAGSGEVTSYTDANITANWTITGGKVKYFIFVANVVKDQTELDNLFPDGMLLSAALNTLSKQVLANNQHSSKIFNPAFGGNETSNENLYMPMVGIACTGNSANNFVTPTNVNTKIDIDNLTLDMGVKFIRSVARIDIQNNIQNMVIKKASLKNVSKSGYIFDNTIRRAIDGVSEISDEASGGDVSDIQAICSGLTGGASGLEYVGTDANKKKKGQGAFYLYPRGEKGNLGQAVTLHIEGTANITGVGNVELNFDIPLPKNGEPTKGRAIQRNYAYTIVIGNGGNIAQNATPGIAVIDVDDWGNEDVSDLLGKMNLIKLTNSTGNPAYNIDENADIKGDGSLIAPKVTLPSNGAHNLTYDITSLFTGGAHHEIELKQERNKPFNTNNTWCRRKNPIRHDKLELEIDAYTIRKIKRSIVVAIHLKDSDKPMYEFLIEQPK